MMQFSTTVFLLFSFWPLALARPNAFKYNDIKRIHAICQADPDTHVDDFLEHLRKYDTFEVPNMPKHTLCMNVNAGLQYSNGDVAVQRLRNDLEEVSGDTEKVNEVVNACGVRAPGTPEDAAMALAKCLCKQWPQHAVCVCDM